MMTPIQVLEWFQAATDRLERLKGPLNFWGQSAPMPVRFNDGHGVHVGDLQALHQALGETTDRALSRSFGENGPAGGVTAEQAFIETFCIIANAQRVEPER